MPAVQLFLFPGSHIQYINSSFLHTIPKREWMDQGSSTTQGRGSDQIPSSSKWHLFIYSDGPGAIPSPKIYANFSFCSLSFFTNAVMNSSSNAVSLQSHISPYFAIANSQIMWVPNAPICVYEELRVKFLRTKPDWGKIKYLRTVRQEKRENKRAYHCWDESWF
jgi:hypothetical protein